MLSTENISWIRFHYTVYISIAPAQDTKKFYANVLMEKNNNITKLKHNTIDFLTYFFNASYKYYET